MKVMLTAVILLASVSAHSAPMMPVKADPGDYTWMTNETFQKEKAKARERSQRKIASSEINDQQMSPALKTTREKFLSIKTPQELGTLLQKLDQEYASAPDDLKLITAMLVPLLKFRAFTYKLYPYLSQEKITHSLLLSMAQNFASFMTMNLPTEQWRAGFDFVTIPTEENDLKQFQGVADLQNYLITDVYPAYVKAAARLKNLNFSNQGVVWDNRFFYGTASFSDNLARYQLVGEGERYAMLANINFALSDICKFASYDLTSFLPLLKDVAALYGYDSFLSPVDGVTAKKLHNILKRPAYAKLYTRRPNGDHNMGVAFKHLKEGAENLNLSWQELKERNDGNRNFIRAAVFAPFTQVIDTQVEDFVSLVNGKTPVRSDVTGELVAVNLPEFFVHPPQDLKTLLPVGFDESPKMQTYSVALKDGKTKSVKFRNYFSGRAVRWNVDAYKSLLPDIKKDQDVPHAMRIINQSVSGLMPALIMQPFMLY